MASDALTNKAAEILGQLQSLSPKATDIALRAAQAEAYSYLCQGVLGVIILIALWLVFKNAYLPRAKVSDEVAIFGGVAMALGAAMGLTLAIYGLLDPWVYITIAHPDLYIAHQLMGRV